MVDNPLTRFYRQPAVYIKLPSGGKYWRDGSLDMPPNGEIPVMPMSGKDDLAMRNADGLMNGATTVSVIESCCPCVKDAWATPSIDMDAIMIAIRIASYGNKMGFETNCNKCKEPLEYEADLTQILDGISAPNFDQPLSVGDLMVWLRPNTYKALNDTNMEIYAQQRTIKSITEGGISEEEKIKRFREAIAEMTKNTVSRLADFVDSIMTPDGSRVTDRNQIEEFLENADQKTYSAIREGLANLNQQYSIPKMRIRCDACNHEDEREFQFEPSNFFG